jgi:hypothetical protein
MVPEKIVTKKLKAFPLYSGSSGCDYHRIKLPFLYGGEHFDGEAHLGFEPAKLKEYVQASDVVVYNRHFPLGFQWLNDLKKESGFKIIVDVDDWVILPDYHPLYKEYKNGGAKMIIDNVRNADCVTVTTDRLYQKFKAYNKNTHVIPNALPYGFGQFTEKPVTDTCSHDAPFTFVYTGQSSHLEDVRLMQADINKSRNLPIAFQLAGFSTRSPIVWSKIEKVFSSHPNYKRIHSRPLAEYMTVYDEADCALVPLCVHDFNSCKSNLKLLEAGAKKVPCIVSHVSPYRDDIDVPVLWVKQAGDWYKHFKLLSENPQAAVEMGEKLHAYVKEKYDLFKWNKVRFELYESLLK